MFQLSKVSEKIKDDLNLDGVGAVEPQNFDVQLENHRNECETTLEKLLSTVHDGEKLSQQLVDDCSVNADCKDKSGM